MAKGIEMNGMLRGKRGGVVYYRQGGEQTSRVRNYHPANPQTQAQMAQRLALANASKAAKGFAKLVDHSFESIKYGVDSVRHFQSQAQAVLKAASPTLVGESNTLVTPLVPMDAIGFPVAKFVLSEGTLDSAKLSLHRNAVSGYIISAGAATDATAITDITVRDFFDIFDIPLTTMQLTIVRTYAQESVGGAGSEEIFYDNRIAPFVRLNFDQSKLDEVMFDANGGILDDVVDIEKSNNWGDLTFEVGIDMLTINLGVNCSGFAMILSLFENGKWRRSTETLEIAATEGTGAVVSNLQYWGWNDYTSILSLLEKKQNVSEDYYLNKEKNPTAGE